MDPFKEVHGRQLCGRVAANSKAHPTKKTIIVEVRMSSVQSLVERQKRLKYKPRRGGLFILLFGTVLILVIFGIYCIVNFSSRGFSERKSLPPPVNKSNISHLG